MSGGIPSIRASVLARYLQFFKSVKTSPSLEVRVIANLDVADVSSNTGNNLFNLGKEAGMDLSMDNMWKLRRVLLDLKAQVPVQDTWRLGCLS